MPVMSYATWMEESAGESHWYGDDTRNEYLLQVDEGVKNYEKKQSDSARQALYARLQIWIKDHEDRKGQGKWKSSVFNRKKAIEKLLDQVTPQSRLFTGAKETNEVLKYKEEIAHSRYGVLYLFSKTDIDLNMFSIVLESASALASAGVQAAGTNYSNLHDIHRSQRDWKVAPGDINAIHGVVAKVGSKMLAKTGTRDNSDRQFVTRPDGALNADGSEGFTIHRAVHGVEPAKPMPGYPLTQKALDHTNFQQRPWEAAARWCTVIPYHAAREAMQRLWVKIENCFNSFVEWFKNKLMAMSYGNFTWQISGTVISKLVNFVVAKCLEAAAPFVSAGMSFAGGLAQGFQAIKDRIEAYFMRSQISINPGHPELAANTIEAAMKQGIFVGLWSVIKGAANLALTIALPGAGSLVLALAAGLEWLVKIIYRFWEQSKIHQFLLTARDLYNTEKTRAKKVVDTGWMDKDTMRNLRRYEPELDASSGGIIHNLDDFKAFYQKGCDASPIIPMITLNSGICGSLWTMLRLFENTEPAGLGVGRLMITQDQFDKGNDYFQHLKSYGRTYLETSGFKIKGRTPDVQGYLNHAEFGHNKSYSAVDNALSFVSGMA
jgi:hypothetical protein